MKNISKSIALAAGVVWLAGAGSADPVELTRSLFEKLNEGAPHSEIAAIFAEDYVDRNRMPQVPDGVSDYQAMTGFLEQLSLAFDGRQYQINLLEAVGDDAALVHWTMTSDHTGELFGIPATGRPVQLDGMDVLRYDGDQIVEHWHVEQLLTLMGQLTGS